MKNGDYWKQRFTQLEGKQHMSASQTAKYVDDEFRKAQKDVEDKISGWYARLAKNNGVSMAEARKLLSKGELEEFKWTVEDYIKHGEENGISADWTKQLENASAKFHISRYEALQTEIRQSVESLYGKTEKTLVEHLKETYLSGYNHSAFEIQKGLNIGWNMSAIDERQLDKIVAKPWTTDGYNFSERIWSNKQKLIGELHTQMTQNIMLGRSPDESIKTIADKFNTSRSNAARLVQTESSYVAAQAQKDCFNDLDVEEFEVVATLDEVTCPICGELDGQHYDMNDFEPGVTANPFHPRCRCTTVPYFPDDEGERIARNEDGEAEYVPSDMTYKEWKAKFVDKSEKSDIIKIRKDYSSEEITWLAKGKKISSAEYKSLREYANIHNILLQGFKTSDVEINLIKNSIDSISDVTNIFPELLGDNKRKLTLSLSNTMSANDFAEINKGVPHIIKLNADAYKSSAKLEKEYSELADDNWFVQGTDYNSIVKHELGHLYQTIHSISDDCIIQMAMEITKVSDKKALFKFLKKNLSEYSGSYKDGSEIISEVFSDYFGSSETTDFSKKFINKLFEMR